LQSLAFQTQGNAARARVRLEQALALAEPEGYVRIFVDEGSAMHALLADFQSQAARKISADAGGSSPRLSVYAAKLLAAFSPSAPVGGPTPDASLEPLSRRELDVLRMIAAGHSNKEIAESLVITVSTVKSHINNLYSKLGTQRRTQAILIARERALLSD
jgi:LuxR family maltose regulon positive regulatory protein